MATVVKAPHCRDYDSREIGIFLGGSIDQGKAVDWQSQFIKAFEKYPDYVTLYSPRRDDYDATWVQDISNPQFKEQVEWELTQLEDVDLTIFYFDPNGLAPITLMELGCFGSNYNTLVCCPEGYWRRGNVQVYCERYGIPLFDNLDDLIYNTELWLSRRL